MNGGGGGSHLRGGQGHDRNANPPPPPVPGGENDRRYAGGPTSPTMDGGFHRMGYDPRDGRHRDIDRGGRLPSHEEPTGWGQVPNRNEEGRPRPNDGTHHWRQHQHRTSSSGFEESIQRAPPPSSNGFGYASRRGGGNDRGNLWDEGILAPPAPSQRNGSTSNGHRSDSPYDGFDLPYQRNGNGGAGGFEPTHFSGSIFENGGFGAPTRRSPNGVVAQPSQHPNKQQQSQQNSSVQGGGGNGGRTTSQNNMVTSPFDTVTSGGGGSIFDSVQAVTNPTVPVTAVGASVSKDISPGGNNNSNPNGRSPSQETEKAIFDLVDSS